MELKDKVVELEQTLKQTQGDINKLTDDSKQLDNQLAEVRKYKQVIANIEKQLFALKEKRQALEVYMNKQKEAIRAELDDKVEK